MKTIARSAHLTIWLLSIVFVAGCGNLKFQSLKGSSVENPPLERVKVYIKEFPVTSKANVVDPNAALSDGGYGGGGSSINSRLGMRSWSFPALRA